MRQFKFIRGKYTDENIFNSDETTACLFAYDKNGKLVEFTVKNDKDFQDKFAELSSDRLSEIYTLRPSQFEISAKQEEAGHYSFDFKANENVLDGSVPFPSDVIKNAQLNIKAKTTAKFTTNKIPVLNLDGDDDGEKKTLTTFTFNNKKTFTRNLVFKVSGFLKERGYATAQGENIDAYPTADGKIDFGGTTGSNKVTGTFYQGKSQTAAPTETGSIIHNTKTINTKGNLDLAKNYQAASGFRFIKGGQFATDIPYNDDLSFTLYEEVADYLTEATADEAAVTNKQFSSNEPKYKSIGDGQYELYSSAGADDENVQYFLIKQGGTSSPKLRKLSATADIYSVITEEGGYYLVDDSTPKHTTNLGFHQKNIDEILSSGPSGESKTIGNARIAFVKKGDSWEKLPAGAVITQKYYATLDNGNTKTYIDTITVNNTNDAYIVNGSMNFPLTCGINADLLYNNIVLDTRNFCMFDASNPSQYVNSAYFDTAVVSGATELDWNGYFYTLEEAAITTTYSLNLGFVAYPKNETLDTLIDESKNPVYKRNANEKTIIDSLNYNFYRLRTGTAYMRKGDCTVPAGLRRATEFVEGYAASYERYYVFKDGQLSNISADDLLNKSTIAYYENNNHHIVGNGVYDDSTDTTRYVALSEDEWVTGVPINSDNTLVKDGNVIAPNTTENVLRFITKVEVNATQTD